MPSQNVADPFVNRNGFKLDTLHDCEVYILDHTSQVQVGGHTRSVASGATWFGTPRTAVAA